MRTDKKEATELKKTSGRGTDFRNFDSDAKNSAFSLVFALLILIALSCLPLAFSALGKAKMQNLEKRAKAFQQNLETRNEEVLENWKNFCAEENKNEAD